MHILHLGKASIFKLYRRVGDRARYVECEVRYCAFQDNLFHNALFAFLLQCIN